MFCRLSRCVIDERIIISSDVRDFRTNLGVLIWIQIAEGEVRSLWYMRCCTQQRSTYVSRVSGRLGCVVGRKASLAKDWRGGRGG